MKTNYFEHNIPLTLPAHMDESKREAWTNMALTVDARMAMLEDAREQSGLCGEDFSAAIAPFFDKNEEAPLLDSMSAEEIAKIAQMQSKLTGAQPKRMEWPNCEVVVDTAFTTTREWEMIRSLGIGGSEAATVIGISPYQTQQQLYHLKVGTQTLWAPTDEGKDFIFAYGHSVESLVIETFCHRAGAVVVPESRMFRNKDYPWIIADVDGIVLLPPDARHPDGKLYVFEAKSSTRYNASAWRDDLVPEHYIPQCRQYPSVLNDPRILGTYIGCIWGNTPDCFAAKLVARDIDAEREQLQCEDRFWKDHILSHVEPSPSGDPEKDTQMIRTLSGAADPKAEKLTLDESLRDQVSSAMSINEKISELKAQVEKLQKQKDSLLLDVKEAMGNHTKATLTAEDGKVWTFQWSPVKRTVTDTEKLKLRYPDVYEDVVTVVPESSRRFSVR